MGKNLRFWDPTKSAIRYASDYNNDGSDTLGIQEALDDLPAIDAGVRMGGVVVDVGGEISDTITVYGGQTLFSYHLPWRDTTFTSLAWLKMADGINKDMIRLVDDGANLITRVFPALINIGLFGNAANNVVSGSCVKVDGNVMDAYIKNVIMSGARENALHFNGSSIKVWVDDCYMELNVRDGIYIQAATYANVRNCYIYGNQRFGVELDSCKGNLSQNSIFSSYKDNLLGGTNTRDWCIMGNKFHGAGRIPAVDRNDIYLWRSNNIIISGNHFGEQYAQAVDHCNHGIYLGAGLSTGLKNIQIYGNSFHNIISSPIFIAHPEVTLEEIKIGHNWGNSWTKQYLHRFKDAWVGHSLDTTHKWRGQATGTGVLPAYTAGPSFETVLFDIAAAGAGTSTLDMNGQRPFDAQFNSYINGSCFLDDVSEADLYFGFYKDADEYAYFHVTAGDVYVKANDGGVHGPYSEDTLVNVGDAETFHMMVEMLRSETPRFKLNGAVVGTPTVGSAPSTGVGVDAYVHLANRNNNAIQGYLNPVEVTSGRDLW